MSTRYKTAKTAVDTKTAQMLEGVLLDTFTASAMVAVYEAMNEDNRAKFDSVPLDKLASFCLQQVK